MSAQQTKQEYDLSEAERLIVELRKEVKLFTGRKSNFIDNVIDALQIAGYPSKLISKWIQDQLKEEIELGEIGPSTIYRRCKIKGCLAEHGSNQFQLKAIDNGNGTATVFRQNDEGRIVDKFSVEVPKMDFQMNVLNSSPPPEPEPRCEICQCELSNEFHEENKEYIHRLRLVKEHISDVETRLMDEPYLSKLPENDVQEFYAVFDRAFNYVKEMWDRRQTVPLVTQFKLTNLTLESTIKHGAGLFVKWLKDFGEFTSKQSTKTLKGIVPDVDFVFEPSNKEEAIPDFIGIPCPKCSRWRVSPGESPGVAHCWPCDEDFHFTPEKLGYRQLQEQNQAELEAEAV